MPYMLDANVFIQANRLHYGLDFCPAFWDWIIRGNSAGLVFSIEKVFDEIQAGNDNLAPWAKDRGPGLFLPPTAAMAGSLRTVATWATGQRYEQAAVDTFLRVGDYYLVSHAHAHGYTVVTHEIPSTSTKRIKIPDACLGVTVRYLTPFEMLRNERARFVLPARPPTSLLPGGP